MIFRRLYKRRVALAFGRFLMEQQLEKIMADFSEWDCFRLLLPRSVYRLLFSTTKTEAEALSEIVRMANQVLADARHSGNVSNQQSSTNKMMKSATNFLAYVKSYLGNEALVFSCDNEGLNYLWNIFAQGFPDDTRSSFKIGNDEHISSDGLCEIEIKKGEPLSSIKIERKTTWNSFGQYH